MDIRKIIVMVMLCATATSCAELKKRYYDFAETIGQDDRSPGEKMRLSPSEVWSREDCSNRILPFFRMDQNNIVPENVRPGEKISHRMEYSVCPRTADSAVRGRLTTSVYYGLRPIQTEKTDNFEIRPGRWVVDTDIYVPIGAMPGEYSLRTIFSSLEINFTDVVLLNIIP